VTGQAEAAQEEPFEPGAWMRRYLDRLEALGPLPADPEAPTDLAIQYRHYMYGLPRRS